MTQEEYQKIAMAIWRAGFIEDKNQVRQAAKVKARGLVASNLIGEFRQDPKFDEAQFTKSCGL